MNYIIIIIIIIIIILTARRYAVFNNGCTHYTFIKYIKMFENVV